MPYCTHCGTQVADEMVFCPKCGHRLITPAASTQNGKSSGYAAGAEAGKQEAIPSHGVRKSKLYKEWVKYAGLPTEEIPSAKAPRDVPLRVEPRAGRSSRFYILLGVGIALCAALIILLVKTW